MAVSEEGISEFELLRRMSDVLNAERARDAWAAFYVRHFSVVLRICICNLRYEYDQEAIRDCTQEAFVSAFKNAATFDFAERCDSSTETRKIRAWLCSVAANLLRDRFRRQPAIETMDTDELESFSPCAQEYVEQHESERLTILKMALETLTETEQTILRATMFHFHAGQEHQRMPNLAVKSLCDDLDISPANLRKIRSRAMAKLKASVLKQVTA